jgi:hypothetical protein
VAVEIKNNGDPNFLSRVLFTDEVMFGREGCFNAHNWHVWAEENPHALFHRGFQGRFSINLWADLLVDRTVTSSEAIFLISLLFKIGPFEFPGRLTGQRYAQFIRNELEDLLEDVPLVFRANCWYEHDGAPPHFSRDVMTLLDQQYPQR